jgi:hypothetical protein
MITLDLLELLNGPSEDVLDALNAIDAAFAAAEIRRLEDLATLQSQWDGAKALAIAAGDEAQQLHASAIATLQSDLSTAQGQVTTLQQQLATATSDLQTKSFQVGSVTIDLERVQIEKAAVVADLAAMTSARDALALKLQAALNPPVPDLILQMTATFKGALAQLPEESRGQFAAPFAIVRMLMEFGETELAIAAIQMVAVPEELEPVKAQLIALVTGTGESLQAESNPES